MLPEPPGLLSGLVPHTADVGSYARAPADTSAVFSTDTSLISLALDCTRVIPKAEICSSI